MKQDRLCLQLMSVPLRITCDHLLSCVIKDRFTAFLASPSDGRLAYSVRLHSLDHALDHPRRPEVSGSGGFYTFVRHDMSGSIDSGKRLIQARLWPNQYSLETMLRIIYSVLLMRKGGCLIHASSVAWANQGFLFVGPSGSGKTTIAHLLPEVAILSDEISALAPWQGVYHLFGNTFFSDDQEKGLARQVPLKRVFFLFHGRQNTCLPMRSQAATRILLQTVMFFLRDNSAGLQMMDTLIALVEQVPCFALHFLPEPAVWQTILSTI